MFKNVQKIKKVNKIYGKLTALKIVQKLKDL